MSAFPQSLGSRELTERQRRDGDKGAPGELRSPEPKAGGVPLDRAASSWVPGRQKGLGDFSKMRARPSSRRRLGIAFPGQPRAGTPDRGSARCTSRAAHSAAAAERRCHGDLRRAAGREAPGDVGAARGRSPVASQLLPILEESRSSAAEARAGAFKGNWRPGGSARAWARPRPRAARPARVAKPLAPDPLHPPDSRRPPTPAAPSTHSREISIVEKFLALVPRPPPLPTLATGGDSCSIGSLQGHQRPGLARLGDPLWTRPLRGVTR